MKRKKRGLLYTTSVVLALSSLPLLVNFNVKASSSVIAETYTNPLSIIKTTTANTLPISTESIGGSDRYITSAEVAQSNIKSGAKSLVVVSGTDYHDAVVSSAFAKQVDGTLLMLPRKGIPQQTKLVLSSTNVNKAMKVYVVGNYVSAPINIDAQFKELGFLNIEHISGDSIYETNQKIIAKMDVQNGTPLILVNSQGYADGISVSSISAIKGYPILYTNADTISDTALAEIKKIKPQKIYLIGGSGSISNNLESSLHSLANLQTESIVRLAGNDRYETNSAILTKFNIQSNRAAYAYGGETNTDGKFADAISATAYAVFNNSPVILIGNSEAVNVPKRLLSEVHNYNYKVFFGGDSSISPETKSFMSQHQDVIQNKQ